MPETHEQPERNAWVKYPRTYHLPSSPGATSDDKRLDPAVVESWRGQQVVITEKMDGENTTMYRDGLHARSLDFTPHPSRERVKALWANIAHEIPPGWRICGENVTAVHSIKYTNLLSYFLVYSIWEGATCIPWDETNEWCALLGLVTVPLLYWGEFTPGMEEAIVHTLDLSCQEGLVIRPAGAFRYEEFPLRVGKYVRPAHVQTNEHWLTAQIQYNELYQG